MAMIRNAVGWYTTKLYANPFKASFKIDKISDVCSVGDKKTSVNADPIEPSENPRQPLSLMIIKIVFRV